MATATRTRKKAEKKEKAKLTSFRYEEISLQDIVSNVGQSRGMGVLYRLQDEGYGVFEKTSTDKEAIWTLLFSDKPEEQRFGCNLLKEREPELVEDAESMRTESQLQPIGVWDTGDGYDVIFGMRRTLMLAYNYAEHGASDMIQAKIHEFDGTPTTGQLRLMAMCENDARQAESPIDLALTFKKLMDEDGLSLQEIADARGKTKQWAQRHLWLLEKWLTDDERAKIHLGPEKGGKGIQWGLDLRQKRKDAAAAGKDSDEVKDTRSESQGKFKLHSVKVYIKLLEAGKKPKRIEDEEWEFLCDPHVRRYLCYKLGLSEKLYGEFKPEPEKEDKPAKSKKDKAGDDGKKHKTLVVSKKKAQDLLVSLGKSQARTWSDDVLIDKLENIPNQMEDEDQQAETPALQKLLEKLLDHYKEGGKIKLKD